MDASTFNVGDRLDVLHEGVWYETKIREKNRHRVFVHYVNWSNDDDEWIDFKTQQDRIAPLHTHTKPRSKTKPGSKQKKSHLSSLMYTPKQVPLEYQHIIGACQRGDLAAIKAHWKPEFRDHFLQIGPDDTWHPLLHAAHHLNVDVVQFLCEQGLNPHQKGTVHPYTGDGLIVAELQGVSPVEVVDRMLFIHTRRSKRKVKLLQVKEVLMKAAHYLNLGLPYPSHDYEGQGKEEEGKTSMEGAGDAGAAASTPREEEDADMNGSDSDTPVRRSSRDRSGPGRRMGPGATVSAVPLGPYGVPDFAGLSENGPAAAEAPQGSSKPSTPASTTAAPPRAASQQQHASAAGGAAGAAATTTAPHKPSPLKREVVGSKPPATPGKKDKDLKKRRSTPDKAMKEKASKPVEAGKRRELKMKKAAKEKRSKGVTEAKPKATAVSPGTALPAEAEASSAAAPKPLRPMERPAAAQPDAVMASPTATLGAAKPSGAPTRESAKKARKAQAPGSRLQPRSRSREPTAPSPLQLRVNTNMSVASVTQAFGDALPTLAGDWATDEGYDLLKLREAAGYVPRLPTEQAPQSSQHASSSTQVQGFPRPDVEAVIACLLDGLPRTSAVSVGIDAAAAATRPREWQGLEALETAKTKLQSEGLRFQTPTKAADTEDGSPFATPSQGEAPSASLVTPDPLSLGLPPPREKLHPTRLEERFGSISKGTDDAVPAAATSPSTEEKDDAAPSDALALHSLLSHVQVSAPFGGAPPTSSAPRCSYYKDLIEYSNAQRRKATAAVVHVHLNDGLNVKDINEKGLTALKSSTESFYLTLRAITGAVTLNQDAHVLVTWNVQGALCNIEKQMQSILPAMEARLLERAAIVKDGKGRRFLLKACKKAQPAAAYTMEGVPADAPKEAAGHGGSETHSSKRRKVDAGDRGKRSDENALYERNGWLMMHLQLSQVDFY